MDTSSEYIAMCDCDEVQSQWGYKEGDWVHEKKFTRNPPSTTLFCLDRDIKDDYFGDNWATFEEQIEDLKKSEAVWLPRQDQLQDMLQPIELHELLDICGEADGIMWEALHEYATSMEQLWLAFYMYEKHGKVWNEMEGKWQVVGK